MEMAAEDEAPLLGEPAVGAEAQDGREGSKDGFNGYLIFCVFVAVFGGTFQFGYNTGVVNSPEDVIRHALADCDSSKRDCSDAALSDAFWSAVVAMFAVGGLFGALAAGAVVQHLGIRKTYLVNNLLLVAAALLMALARSASVLIIGRLVVGIAGGVTTVITPMYISDISPLAVRGTLGVMTQLAITLGILIAQCLGLGSVLGNSAGWRYLLALPIVPAVLQTILLFWTPESPAISVAHKQIEQATGTLRRLRRRQAVEDEIAVLQEEVNRNAQATQQLTGINAIFYFSAGIFETAGLSNGDSATIVVGAVNVVMTIVASQLMDRLGRRVLLGSGLLGMVIGFVLLTVALAVKASVSALALIGVALVVVAFALGPGAIPWLMIPELFASDKVAAAAAICVAANWLFNFIVGMTFQPLQSAMGEYVFLVFVVLAALGVGFTATAVPETRGKKAA
ncbi:uncharacterized protein MONBRDRAFT_28107 [Monosiga brevicollis MX1]|uniref:Major facilitator superfamily (MFS) profile domain-containing protein n=1 Tax=Monosiga brevicollis TaxID=81824 RepID=A9V779_MONBE|nr:uncharacterized protein MONBRDRAFT_28107 [Monosiga brevicollis MX1]EDQ86674.1 predicted protein [Monosiga brevicollis MX1]|eukprot:XP_001748510.1 hypothetical protein [Monosiga brevicollis MX1]